MLDQIRKKITSCGLLVGSFFCGLEHIRFYMQLQYFEVCILYLKDTCS